jgi:hypothetical protein
MTEAERGQLVRRVERGDADALQRLLVEYYAALHQFVAVRLELGLRARVEPEDVLQEACVAAFRAVAGTGRDQGSKGSRARGSGDQGIAGSRDRRSGDGTGDADGEAAEPSGSVGDKGAAGARNAEAADEGVAKAGGDGQDVGTGRLVFAGPAQFYGWLERIVRSKLGEARRAARRQKRDVGREAGRGGGGGRAGGAGGGRAGGGRKTRRATGRARPGHDVHGVDCSAPRIEHDAESGAVAQGGRGVVADRLGAAAGGAADGGSVAVPRRRSGGRDRAAAGEGRDGGVSGDSSGVEAVGGDALKLSSAREVRLLGGIRGLLRDWRLVGGHRRLFFLRVVVPPALRRGRRGRPRILRRG